jgi:small subunit ribosomal protein S18
MNYSKKKTKQKIFSSTKRKPVVAIVPQKSKKNFPLQSRPGTIDYKNVVLLRKFISADGKILPRRVSRLNAKQQRYIANAIKNARMVGLLPFINYSGPSFL